MTSVTAPAPQDLPKDPLGPLTLPAWLYWPVMLAPLSLVVNVVIRSALTAPAPGWWRYIAPALTLIALTIAFGFVLRRSGVGGPRAPRWEPVTRLLGKPREWDPDLSALDLSGLLGWAVAAALVSGAAVALILWLARLAGVQAGARIALFFGSLAIGALAGSAGVVGVFDLLMPTLALYVWWRRSELRPTAAVSASAAMLHAARYLEHGWARDTQTEQRRQARRRIELAANLAEGGAPTREVRAERQTAAAALRLLIFVLYNTGDAERTRVREALTRAAPLAAVGEWVATRDVAVAVARALGVEARQAALVPALRRSRARTITFAAVGLTVSVVGAVALWRLSLLTGSKNPGPQETAAAAAIDRAAAQLGAFAFTAFGVGLGAWLSAFAKQIGAAHPLLSGVFAAEGEHLTKAARGKASESSAAEGASGNEGDDDESTPAKGEP